MTSALAVLVLLVITAEAAYLWLGQLDRRQAEADYWSAREHRPALYDWAEELDL